jgi:cysteinyl-tRNA synthetase
MALSFYNSLTKKIEPFVPLDTAGKHVGLYTCGPTVYNYAHIGNFRAYIFGDTVKRALLHFGYSVNHVMNLTDVEDKTIRDSQSNGKSLEEFTQFYADAFKKDCALLNILPPTQYTRAVEHIDDMVSLIETLIEKGFAYKSDDGSVYFDVRKDTKYGQLSSIAISEKKSNAAGRIMADEYDKESAEDFALWKAWDENDGDIFWETSLGKGRPGWHIECSAMSMKYLGESFDIHTGGIDLVFPHHENEIAQSECATGKPFVKYWLHNEWVMVDGKKMSKSAGNFHTLNSLVEAGFNPLAFRLWVLSGHYRTQMNFTLEALNAHHSALSRIQNHFILLGTEASTPIQEYVKRIETYLSEDLHTPKIIATIWEILQDETHSENERRATLLLIDSILGLGLSSIVRTPIPKKILLLSRMREAARVMKDFKRSDEIRNEIHDLGYEIQDTENGPTIVKI